MNMQSFDTPILLIIFNRIDTAQRVFDEIRKIKPKILYIAADGPRIDKQGEAEKCQKTRNIVNQIDWNCEIKTLFREKNLGCRDAVSSAINWFFENVEEGIILEDDCLPDQSFFYFCEQMLEYYRNDSRIMHINGSNFQKGKTRGDGSYYFSKMSFSWGWASWRRAWKYMDLEIKTYPEFCKQNIAKNIFSGKFTQKSFIKYFMKMYKQLGQDWDAQWLYSILVQNGLCVVPNINLITNIGFGEDAVHTIAKNHRLANMKRGSIEIIIHPTFMIQNKDADTFIYDEFFYTFKGRIKRELTRIFKLYKG